MPKRRAAFPSLRAAFVVAYLALALALGTATPAWAYNHVGELREVDGQWVVDKRDPAATAELTQSQAWQQDLPYFAGPIDDADQALMADLLRVQRILQRPAVAMAALDDLEASTRQLSEQGLEPAAALEQALATKETEHYFPDARIVALGLLTEKTFMELPTQGFVLTDVGAGLRHGELAHRLQWAMIISTFEQAPDDWNHTPFELFTKIGEMDRKLAGLADKRNPNLWSHLFDQGGLDSAEVKGIKNPNVTFAGDGADGYRHPDRLTVAMVTGRDRHLVMPTAIAAGVKQRYEQRKPAYDRARKASKQWRSAVFARDMKKQLTPHGYEPWRDRNLLVHEDDKAAADAENATTKPVRIKLSRERWKGETAHFDSADQRAAAETLERRRLTLIAEPKPIATPLPKKRSERAPPPPPPLSAEAANTSTTQLAPPPPPGPSIADAVAGADEGGKSKPRPKRRTH